MKPIVFWLTACFMAVASAASAQSLEGEWQDDAVAAAIAEHEVNRPEACTETSTEPSGIYALFLGEDSAARDALFVEFVCRVGAYNTSSVYYLADQYLVVTPTWFPSPQISEPDPDGGVEIIDTIDSREVVNARYESGGRVMVEHNKWRGLDDAYTETRWGFRHGRFEIMYFAVDTSFDGEREPQVLIERDIW